MKVVKAAALLLLLLCMPHNAGAEILKVACVGNSVTYGYGLQHREQDCYPAQLQRILSDGYEVGNFGHSGATLLFKGHRPYVGLPAFRNALDYNPDIVVIHLGLNDTDPRDWPDYRDDFVGDYCALIDSFRTRNPSARIMICRMTPIFHRHPRFKSSTRDWFRQIQDAIGHVARARGVELVDLHTPLSCRPELFSDALHPDEEGAGIIAATVAGAVTGDYGGLRLPPLYTSGMVIQRDQPVVVRGQADAGSPVTLLFKDQVRSVRAGRDGQWSVTLSPMAADGRGDRLTVMAPDSIIHLDDVVVGDVWICSGQSNMAFRVNESVGPEVDNNIEYVRSGSQIRLYDMRPRYYTTNEAWDSAARDLVNHLEYYHPARWVRTDSASVAEFSAVGFAFGRNLADSLDVPIGLISNSVGGSPIESWIDRETLQQELPDILYDFANNDMIQSWVRERAMVNSAGESADMRRHPYHPAYLYESAMAPIEGLAVKGVIWYQGESNAHNAELHSRLFPLLVSSWRKGFGSEVPFYFAQLTSINRPSWPVFRDSQRRLAAAVPGVAMAVIHDLGDSLDVHPRRKLEVGRRLALAALYHSYGHDLECSGPVPVSARADGRGTVTLMFTHSDGLSTSDGMDPRTFELAADDHYFYPAQALINVDGSVTLKSDRVPHPCYVRYAWQPYTRANLVNASGLPASTFMVDVTAE